MPKSISATIEEGSKLDILSEQILKLSQEYWEEYSRVYQPQAVIWVKNDETGQFFAYTRGEYSQSIIKHISQL